MINYLGLRDSDKNVNNGFVIEFLYQLNKFRLEVELVFCF